MKPWLDELEMQQHAGVSIQADLVGLEQHFPVFLEEMIPGRHLKRVKVVFKKRKLGNTDRRAKNPLPDSANLECKNLVDLSPFLVIGFIQIVKEWTMVQEARSVLVTIVCSFRVHIQQCDRNGIAFRYLHPVNQIMQAKVFAGIQEKQLIDIHYHTVLVFTELLEQLVDPFRPIGRVTVAVFSPVQTQIDVLQALQVFGSAVLGKIVNHDEMGDPEGSVILDKIVQQYVFIAEHAEKVDWTRVLTVAKLLMHQFQF